MHEAAAMRGVVNKVLEVMQQAGATQVTCIELVLGASGHFTAEAAQQHFEVFSAGTAIEGAPLKIMWLPATFQCFNCLHRFQSCETASYATCPLCDGVALETEHQDVCYVGAIDVAFDEGNATQHHFVGAGLASTLQES
ncbi:MAG TPA: hydrogenase maturation nickel metallochaperone HypA [Ktedonosporobacter sp.]|jgi:hydrogenase nickel insertion protein HypA|nr:hydrogenase maturation nickel metallochaperone HypA [Ktedonosporobacter sp.]